MGAHPSEYTLFTTFLKVPIQRGFLKSLRVYRNIFPIIRIMQKMYDWKKSYYFFFYLTEGNYHTLMNCETFSPRLSLISQEI